MILCRLILAKWAKQENPNKIDAFEGLFSRKQLKRYNNDGYNIYYWPNYPKDYTPDDTVNGTHIDTFEWVFADMDLKDNKYASKDAFIETIINANMLPTKIVDSGNGVHIYWRVSNLDPMSFLRLQRRIIRKFDTDASMAKLCQLMRLPGTVNVKHKDAFVPCVVLAEDESIVYTAEQIDSLLPPITMEDEKYCQTHHDTTFKVNETYQNIPDKIPAKFGQLVKSNKEVKELWSGDSSDRSRSDYRLGHIMAANDWTPEEAMAVLMNSGKALQRAPIYRMSYAHNIVSKIWTFESTEDKTSLLLSSSVRDILSSSGEDTKGAPFRCHPRIDNTDYGFRLGQVLGLVAGSGVGKTTFALNMFLWFAQSNPDYHHFFIPLEQPAREIAERWNTMTQGSPSLQDKVHVISNYDKDGKFRHLSFSEIKDYIKKFTAVTGSKVGCVVIDHIGALKKKGSKDEYQDLMAICHEMKAFAIDTNTLLVMQSQTSREKAGIGDLELNKDAAYGTATFEWYCDYLITIWQPLKRCHAEPACPTVTAFKYCKIRHKKPKRDIIQEDKPYYLYFDSETEQMRDMTQDEETSFRFFLPKATNKRKGDRRTDLVTYHKVPYKEGEKANENQAERNIDGTRH